jgi:hypothetical protein
MFRECRCQNSGSTSPGSSAGTFADEVALEFGDAGEDRHDHLAGVGGGVGPRFGDGLKTGTGLADCFDDLKQVGSDGIRDEGSESP